MDCAAPIPSIAMFHSAIIRSAESRCSALRTCNLRRAFSAKVFMHNLHGQCRARVMLRMSRHSSTCHLTFMRFVSVRYCHSIHPTGLLFQLASSCRCHQMLSRKALACAGSLFVQLEMLAFPLPLQCKSAFSVIHSDGTICDGL